MKTTYLAMMITLVLVISGTANAGGGDESEAFEHCMQTCWSGKPLSPEAKKECDRSCGPAPASVVPRPHINGEADYSPFGARDRITL